MRVQIKLNDQTGLVLVKEERDALVAKSIDVGWDLFHRMFAVTPTKIDIQEID